MSGLLLANPQPVVLRSTASVHKLNIFNEIQPTILFTTQPKNYDKINITVEQIDFETSLQKF